MEGGEGGRRGVRKAVKQRKGGQPCWVPSRNEEGREGGRRKKGGGRGEEKEEGEGRGRRKCGSLTCPMVLGHSLVEKSL